MEPSPGPYHAQHQLLDSYVRGPGRGQSIRCLKEYFCGDDASGFYTGSRFDRFDGGRDAAAIRDRITPADVLALTFLSISDRLPAVTTDVIETHAERISELLAAIPVDVPIHEADWSLLAPGSAAHRLWDVLRRCGGKNRWVTANKLLARKRPHLLPVYDNDVRRLLGAPDSFWACLWTWFATDNGRQRALAELRSSVGGLEDITLLRCLDVVLWMQARSTVQRSTT